MKHTRRLAGSSLITVALLASAVQARAADPALDQAKTLYEAASFEDALAAIAKVDSAQSAEPEVLLYKALCLLALGRPQEAGVATRTLVNATPSFAPDTGTLPPRFQVLWTDTRRAAHYRRDTRLVQQRARPLSVEGLHSGAPAVRTGAGADKRCGVEGFSRRGRPPNAGVWIHRPRPGCDSEA